MHVYMHTQFGHMQNGSPLYYMHALDYFLYVYKVHTIDRWDDILYLRISLLLIAIYIPYTRLTRYSLACGWVDSVSHLVQTKAKYPGFNLLGGGTSPPNIPASPPKLPTFMEGLT